MTIVPAGAGGLHIRVGHTFRWQIVKMKNFEVSKTRFQPSRRPRSAEQSTRYSLRTLIGLVTGAAIVTAAATAGWRWGVHRDFRAIERANALGEAMNIPSATSFYAYPFFGAAAGGLIGALIAFFLMLLITAPVERISKNSATQIREGP